MIKIPTFTIFRIRALLLIIGLLFLSINFVFWFGTDELLLWAVIVGLVALLLEAIINVIMWFVDKK